MKYLRYLVLLVIGIFLVTIALANRDAVPLHALPPDISAALGVDWTINLPLFLVGFGGVAVGILIGFVWEWIREHKIRRVAKTMTRKVERMEQAGVRPDRPKDEVLALLEAPPGKTG